MKIAMYWTQHPATAKYRMIDYAKELQKLGHDVAIFPRWEPNVESTWQFDWPKNRQLLDEIETLFAAADISIFQRVTTPETVALITALRWKHLKPVVMELDDDFTAVDPDNPGYIGTAPGSMGQDVGAMQLNLSDAIIVSTEHLKNKYNFGNTYVLPNGVVPSEWAALKKPKPHSKVRIGWEGGAAHGRSLTMIADAIDEIALMFPKKVEFVFMGGYLDWMSDKYTCIKATSIDKFPQALRDLGLDIGIAPLKDSEFNRAKSNLRWLQYSMLGIPTIASNVGPYKSIIGFKANEVDEWVTEMAKLVKDKIMRKRVGEKARKEAVSKFNIKNLAKDYERTLKIIRKGFDIEKYKKEEENALTADDNAGPTVSQRTDG